MEPATAVARAANEFGFRLLVQLAPTQDQRNLMISPLGVSMCLTMLHHAAGGATREALASAPGLTGLADETIAAGYDTLGRRRVWSSTVRSCSPSPARCPAANGPFSFSAGWSIRFSPTRTAQSVRARR